MMKVARLRWVDHVIWMSDGEIPKRIRNYNAGKLGIHRVSWIGVNK
jgi:hypothetical protein